MAFKKMDDAALTSNDDASWSAACLSRVAGNVRAINTGRHRRVGFALEADYPMRLCSIRQAAWGPFFVYVTEPISAITVRVRVQSVKEQKCYIKAIAQPAAGPVRLPDYGGVAFTPLSTTITPTTHTLTAAAAGLTGWVAVYLWFYCDMATSAEDSGTGALSVGNMGGWLLTGETASLVEVPERALVLYNYLPGPKSDDRPVGPPRQIGYWDASGKVAYVTPPQFTIDNSGISVSGMAWQIRKVGVIVVSGVWFDQVPFGYDDAAGFYALAPVAETTHGTLVGRLAGLISGRVPQWSCWPGRDNTSWLTDDGKTVWVRRDALDGRPELDGTWRSLAGTVIANAPADSNGYRALVGLVVGILALNPGAFAGLQLRLAAYTVGSAAPSLIVAGTTVDDLTVPEISTWNGYGIESPVVGQSIAALSAFGAWQYDGILTGDWQDTDPAADLRCVWTQEIAIPETDLTYPCEIRLEAKGVDDGSIVTVVGFGLASRSLDEV